MTLVTTDLRGIAVERRSNCANDTPERSRFSPQRFERGAVVTARDRRWRVRGQRTFGRCALVTLDPTRDNRHPALTLVTPADAIVGVHHPASWHRGSIAQGCAVIARALGEVLGSEIPARSLAILPWQFAAARTLVDGRATRVLLADEVGLGKTIQAALAIAALESAGAAERVLVLAPSGLRDQWHGELTRLFGWSPAIVDARELRRRRASLPAHVGPWLAPGITISSVDFVKQPEILISCAAGAWDLVVIDEAHALTPGTDRLAAARAIGRSARRVLLLTGTPHSGDDDEFAAMCGVGELAGDDLPLVVIRRTGESVGCGRQRRVRSLRPRAHPSESRVHSLLDDYVRRVWTTEPDDQSAGRLLAMTILLKRAASSLAALARSLAHRAQCLDQAAALPSQAALPFEGDDGETERDDIDLPAALAAPGLADRRAELRLVTTLLAATLDAVPHDGKLRVLARFVERTHEPLLLFTEYRDTLNALIDCLRGRTTVTVLHGGLNRRERNDALAAFRAGHVRVLAATDVAAEGLNLHERCRLLVNLELPWNPTRLEQRIGRVDRLGQSRPVHATHLIGSNSVESWIARRLARRAMRADRSLRGGLDTETDDVRAAAAALGLPLTDRDMASLGPARDGRASSRGVLHGLVDQIDAGTNVSRSSHTRNSGAGTEVPPYATDASDHGAATGDRPARARVNDMIDGLTDDEHARVLSASALREAVPARTPAILTAAPTVVRLSRCRAARLHLPRGITVVIRFGLTVGGWTPHPRFAAIAIAIDWSRVVAGCAAALRRVMPLVRREAEALAAQRDPAADGSVQFATASLARERALMDVAAPTPGELQAGLFDRRAERRRAAAEESRREQIQRHGSFLVAHETDLAAGPELTVDPLVAFVVR
jgi:superfamily II DNA or RNA helicase